MEHRGGTLGKIKYSIHLADALVWMDSREARSVQAIVTDPPYGLKEYTDIEQRKLRNGRGGVWRIPPSFDGCKRNPVPRFTVLAGNEKAALCSFFAEFAQRAMRVLVPGGHISSLPIRYFLISFMRHLLQRAWKSGARSSA
jgi:tRNA G10  N-methylase Trm11